MDPHFFLNMDQTAVYFESKSRTIVARKGKNLFAKEIVVAMPNVQLLLLQLQPTDPNWIPFLYLRPVQERRLNNKFLTMVLKKLVKLKVGLIQWKQKSG
jgi:hypothetical protein